MDENNIGRFIAECRKERGMTQKELADRLYITDKAVSKWERGLSVPDVSLIVSLSEILGVTTTELLKGRREAAEDELIPGEAPSDEPISENNAEKIADAPDTDTLFEKEQSAVQAISNIKNLTDDKRKTVHKMFRGVAAELFSSLLLLGAIVVLICDVATAGTFTWSLIVLISIALSWLLVFPLIILGKNGILVSLSSLTVFIFPFLWGLNRIISDILNDMPIEQSLILKIGIPSAIYSLIYLWCVYFIFKLKKRVLRAVSAAVLLLVPLCWFVNTGIARVISDPLNVAMNNLSCAVLIIISIILLIADLFKKIRE